MFTRTFARRRSLRATLSVLVLVAGIAVPLTPIVESAGAVAAAPAPSPTDSPTPTATPTPPPTPEPTAVPESTAAPEPAASPVPTEAAPEPTGAASAASEVTPVPSSGPPAALSAEPAPTEAAPEAAASEADVTSSQTAQPRAARNLAARAGESSCNYANAGTGAYAETLCWIDFSAVGSAITTEYRQRNADTDSTSCERPKKKWNCTTTLQFDSVLGADYGSVTATGFFSDKSEDTARTSSHAAATTDLDSLLPATGSSRYGNLGATGFMPYPITVTLQGGYTLTAGVTISSDTAAGRVVAARAFPTYSGAFLGNRDFYTGVGGNPALYQLSSGGSKTTTITLSNVTLRSNGAKTTGFSVVVADAESTDSGESIGWSRQNGSNFSWLPNVPGGTGKTATMGNACPQSYVPALGSTSATAECRANSSSTKTGTPMLQVSPTSASESTSFNITATLGTSGGLQGTAFGIIVARAQTTVQVADRIVGTNGTSLDGTNFSVTVNGGSTASTGATATGATTGGIPVLLNAEGSRVAFDATSPSGALATSYTASWQCFKTDPNSTVRTPWPATGSSPTPPPTSSQFALLRAGQFAHCTVTYTPPYLTLVKQVQNGSTGASNVPADWSLSGTGTSSRASGSGAGVRTAVAAGTYTLAETGPTNPWVHGYRWTGLSCTANTGSTAVGSLTTTPGSPSGSIASGSMPIAPGNDVTCRFVNTAQAQTTLTLVKRVGLLGTALPTDFTLTATAPSGALAGPSGTTGTSGATGVVTPGASYGLSESGGPATYVQDGAWSCVNQRGGTVSVSAGSVSVPAADQVTCTVTNATSRLTLLKQVVNDSGGTVTPEQFSLTATPAVSPTVPGLAGFTVDGASTITSSNSREVRPGHPYALSENMGNYAYLGQSIQVYTGPTGGTGPTPEQLADDRNWQRMLTAAQAAAFTVEAGEHAIVRFVNDDAPPLTLPLTGGIGADSFLLGGAGLLLLGLLAAAVPLVRTRIRSSRKVPLMKTPRPQSAQPSASIQEGSAVMASTKKSLTARVAAGVSAAAIATFAVLGGALPASAAPDNIQSGSVDLTIHMFEEPEGRAPLSNDGSEITSPGALDGLDALDGIEFMVQQVPNQAGTGFIDLNTPAGWADVDQLAGVAAAAQRIQTHGAVPTVSGATGDVTQGEITFSGLDRSLYLVTQVGNGSNQIARQTAPFLVTLPLAADNEWIYDVHVYPKNSTTAITKIVDEGDSYGLGSNVSWTISVDVPEVDVDDVLRSFVVTDEIDARLTLVADEGSMTLTSVNATGDRVDVPLTAADVAIDLSTPVYTVTFTEEGRTLLASLNQAKLVINAVTTVTAVGDGTIENQATLTVNDASFTTASVQTQWGSLDILKHETGDEARVLSGAEFQIFNSEAEAGDPDNAIIVDGASTFTTGADGIAPVAGLRAGTYWLVETEAPAGYQRLTTGRAIEITAGDNQVAIANDQVPAYALPITGGSGQAAFMIGGAGLLVGALGFMLIRRRKAQADA